MTDTVNDLGDLGDLAARQRLRRGDEWLRRARKTDARAAVRNPPVEHDTKAPAYPTAYPSFASRAKGAYVWDVDGNRYIDYLLGYGPVVLGHADDRITSRVVEEIANGNTTRPLWSPLQVELTEALTTLIPGGELAFLLKTGSEANTAAVRLARAFTGRAKVIRWGYCGWHDWTTENRTGVPEAVHANTMKYDYGDLASLRTIFEENPGEIACVIMMPFIELTASATHLRQVRELAHAHGALFILDEMRSGFRMALGGAQEYLNVQADLSTFSKAMANGYPISAVVGRADVMRELARANVSSTFDSGAVEMAAALQTIDILRETDALARIWKLGALLQAGLRDAINATGAQAETVGYPPMPFVRFTHPDPARQARQRDRFFTETARRGLLLHSNHHWYISSAHTEQDIAVTVAACRQAFETAGEQ